MERKKMTFVQNPQTKETKNNRSVYRLVVFILLGIFIGQIFIHLIFHFKLDFEHFTEMILSAFLMVIFLLPVIYRFVVRPMGIEISLRKRGHGGGGCPHRYWFGSRHWTLVHQANRTWCQTVVLCFSPGILLNWR